MPTKTVNISFPKEVMDKFDKVAKSQNWTRSGLIRIAVESYISSHYLPSRIEGEVEQ